MSSSGVDGHRHLKIVQTFEVEESVNHVETGDQHFFGESDFVEVEFNVSKLNLSKNQCQKLMSLLNDNVASQPNPQPIVNLVALLRGATYLAYLYIDLYKATDNTYAEIGGCCLLLQVWAWDRFPKITLNLVDP
ncbi:hypothetical protein L6164_028447 [Bauhinia variegata]|uniref:Uncharacterized protein n=1 Tax=Bauhinia variegata TaxID=167791 RepID=A0ACB9L5Y9_BAUVA|nr:hypothetical protein L6164_028447 [Bauhinia variegata]